MTKNLKISDAALEVARWYRELCETSNSCFMPFYFDTHRYLVLMGGGGSGKSIFAGRKMLERCINERGHRALVLRKVGKTLRESCFRQLIGQCSRHYSDEAIKINHSDMRITFLQSGSEIIFSGLDDVEKLKSIYGITMIWIEEASEITENDFDQLDIRLRDETPHYKQIIVTFNPVSILHWLKRRFFDRRGEDHITHHSTYHDNRFLTKEAIRVLEAFRETNEYYYQVYCLGVWGVVGRTVFNAASVTARLLEAIKPETVGHFEYDYDEISITNIRFVEDECGFISIYKGPEKGVPYVIGGDTAGDGSDAFVGQVIDNRTGYQVATLRHTTDEDLYAKQIYCLGIYYNTALVGVETNFSTYPVRELERLRYPNQYVREVYDDYTGAVRNAFGFRTDTKSRPVIIATLIRAVRDDIRCVVDKTTLEEMLTFVRSESFRPEAEEGAHDDCVMALAIAHGIRDRQSYIIEADEDEGRVKWTPDMYEDYERASESERAYLIKLWGNPN